MSTTIPYSPTLKVGELLFISGQVALDPHTSTMVRSGFEDELIQVMRNLCTHLEQNGLTISHLISTTIYLKDINNFALVNGIYGSFFEEKFPTRTCIAVADLPLEANVEISAIASFTQV